MATPVKMPEIGESVTEGTITRWLKQEGDRVEADEPLFEISTDKVDTEVPSPVSGVLKTIKVREDETVQVGAELAEIEQDGDAQEDGEAGEAASDGGEQAEAGEDETAQEAAEPEGGDEEAAEPEQREAVAEAAPEEDGGGAEEEGGAEEGEEAQPAAKAEGGDGGVTVVTMPEIGESVTEGTITRWLKQEGDRVEADEPLFEISTDKVDTEVPSPAAGVLTAIKAQEDETVQVGAELAEISGEGAAKGKPAAEKPASAKKETPAAAEREEAPAKEREKAPAKAAEPSREAPAGDGQAGDGQPGSVVSPLVRRLAREHDVDLSQVKGSGSGGRVRREDVEAYLEQRGKEPAPARQPAAAGDGKAAAAATPAAKQPAPVPLAKGVREEVTPFPRLRRIIAERMVGSLQTSAQLTAAVEIDMTNVMRLRERAKEDFKKREGVSLSPLPFSIQAVIAAIRTYPNANSALDQDMNLHVYQDVNMGIAVDTSKGLFVPVIRNADQLNLSGLARAIADVAKRTRDGKVDPGELSGSTFTVTNTGSVGTVWDTPIINLPNAAIFATPAIVKRPVVVDDPELGEIIAVRHMMYGIITYDHRILDGADAARFLQRVKEVLEAADFAGELGLSREDAGG